MRLANLPPCGEAAHAVLPQSSCQNPDQPFAQASPFTRQHLPVVCSFSRSTAACGHVCRTGRCKLPRWGRIELAPLSAPFSGLCPPAILLPRLAHPGWRRAETLPVHRSDMFKVQPFTSGQQRASLPKRPACQFGHTCLFSPFEDAGQMQRLPVYRLTFASSSSRSRSTRSR
jgi:hypothetical protein